MKRCHSDVTVLSCVPVEQKAANERSCEWFKLGQNASAEPRLYHLEKQEEERQKTDGTTVQKRGKEK